MINSKSIAKNPVPHDPLTAFLIIAAAVFFALLFFVPLYVLVVNSLKPLSEIHLTPLMAVPLDWTLEPWKIAWSQAKIGAQASGLFPYVVNSFLLVIPVVFITTLIGAFNGYLLAQWRFKGSEWLFALLLISCFIPLQLFLVPMAHLLSILQISDSLIGLIVVHTVYGLGISTIFCRQFYSTISRDIIRAAKLDGAGVFAIFRHIILPISGPIVVISVVWQFTAVWNDFLLGSTFSAANSMPATVALNQLVSTSSSAVDYNIHLAAALIAALPTLIVYLLCSRFFMRGLLLSVLKG